MRASGLKAVFAVLATMAISSCGRAPVLELGQFSNYVERFEEVSAEVGRPVKVADLVVKFGEVGERQDGVCETGDFIPPTIIINSKNWGKMNESAREALMFHELGHCVLFRHHLDKMMAENVPESMMYPVALPPATYDEYRDHYHRELFGVATTTTTTTAAVSAPTQGTSRQAQTHAGCHHEI